MNTTATDNIAAALQPGRVAVITGAASGIGLATAKKLAGRGLKLVVADREGPALYQAIRDLAALAAAARTRSWALPATWQSPTMSKSSPRRPTKNSARYRC